MKRFIKFVAGLLAVSFFASCAREPRWVLAWEETFDGEVLDSTVWSRIPRGRADWANTQSLDERCLELKDGILYLKGIVNDDRTKDTAAFLTGGIWSKGKYAFRGGRIEVRAKLQAAQGAWPAIWMLPFEQRAGWPHDGEIDLMERLNYDSIVYQTVHSHYTYDLGIKDYPVHGGTASIDPDDYNVYGVDIWPDSLVFHVNGVRTFCYPKIRTDEEGQFPFDVPQYLLIDMQLGGQWVGPVDAGDLPVEMQVDWVRHYQWK